VALREKGDRRQGGRRGKGEKAEGRGEQRDEID